MTIATLVWCLLTGTVLALLIHEITERTDEISDRWHAIAERCREITERW
jgi:hypothetical protein